jgi:hypothetical protein
MVAHQCKGSANLSVLGQRWACAALVHQGMLCVSTLPCLAQGGIALVGGTALLQYFPAGHALTGLAVTAHGHSTSKS